MKNIGKKGYLYLAIFLTSLLTLVVILVTHIEDGNIYLFSYDKTAFIFFVIIAGTSLILFFIEKYEIYEKKGFFSTKVNLLKVILVTLSFISISFLGGFLYGYHVYQPEGENWSIGIYASSSNEPLNFTGKYINNPVLTKDDVSDVQADFVADPYLIYDNNTFYMFFEVLNSKTQKGEIGLAISSDGLNWSYQQIVLRKPFHLSYPQVFKWNEEYYMVENHDSSTVALYRANDFPYSWAYVKTILTGDLLHEPTIFQFNSTWWLFSQTHNFDELSLYYSVTPLGPWNEHPENPVLEGDQNISRPGGSVVVFDNRIIRYAQDCEPFYGNQVWAIEIMELTTNNYKEQLVGKEPILKGYENWNTRGMHHISPIRISENKWIACVDGK
jgi:hypothetical protein